MLGHHVVQRLDQRLVDHDLIVREFKDVCHGIAVAGQGRARLLDSIDWLLALHNVEHIVERRPVALDPVRASHGSGEVHPPKVPRPSPRSVLHIVGEITSELADLLDDNQVGAVRLGRAKDPGRHTIIISHNDMINVSLCH